MPRITRVVGAHMYTNACRQVAILNPDDANDARLPCRLAAQSFVERDVGDVTIVVYHQEVLTVRVGGDIQHGACHVWPGRATTAVGRRGGGTMTRTNAQRYMTNVIFTWRNSEMTPRGDFT